MNTPDVTSDSRPAARTRTFSWADPALTAAQIGRRSGLELLKAMASGELPPPPVAQLLGSDRFEVEEEGRIAVVMTIQEFHYNPLGTVHGGVLATLLDTATACAVHSTLPAGMGYTSMDLTTRFLRPATMASRVLRAEGSVISRGRTSALAEGRLTDAAGRLIAHATSTCRLFPVGDAPAAE